MRHHIASFHEYPMPSLRHDAYYGDYMQEAREELEHLGYAFDDKTGVEYERGCWVARYSDPSDYDPTEYATRDAVWSIFATAIKSRAARLFNLANR